ncbi:MAG: hypothetical protein AB3N64_11925, partial [Puniceicoccaceae bacterium]
MTQPTPETPKPSGHLPLVTDSHRPTKTADRDKVPVVEKAMYATGNQSMGMVNQVIEYQAQQVLVYGL